MQVVGGSLPVGDAGANIEQQVAGRRSLGMSGGQTE